jgi:uncharacterized membrane protein
VRVRKINCKRGMGVVKKSKLHSRNSIEVTICILVIIGTFIAFLIFPNQFFFKLFVYSLPGSFLFLYFTYVINLYREINGRKIRKKAVIITRLIYLIVFSIIVILIFYAALTILKGSIHDAINY